MAVHAKADAYRALLAKPSKSPTKPAGTSSTPKNQKIKAGDPIPAPPDPPAAPQAPDINAQRDPRLESTADQYQQYVQDVKTNTGQIADIVGTKMRDSMAGQQQSAMDMAELRGAPVDANQLAAEEGRAVQGALGNVELQREALLGTALSGAENAAQAPVSAALAEKGLGLNSYQAYQNAMNAYNSQMSQNAATAYNQMLSLLEMQRTSPVYDPALAAQPNESYIKTYAPPAQGTEQQVYGYGGYTTGGNNTGAYSASGYRPGGGWF